VKKYRWLFKKPSSGKFITYDISANDEAEAISGTPKVLAGGWIQYKFKGEVKEKP